MGAFGEGDLYQILSFAELTMWRQTPSRNRLPCLTANRSISLELQLKSSSPDQGQTRNRDGKALCRSIPFKITGTNKGQNELRNFFNKLQDPGIKDGFGMFVFKLEQCFAFASVFQSHCVADVLEKEINRQCHLSHANIADYR